MNVYQQIYPDFDSWVAAIHTTEDDFAPRGCGVVIDDRRVLTCAHVADQAAELWIAFPNAEHGTTQSRRRVTRVVSVAQPAIHDLALLVLDDTVPPGVSAAPMRSPKPDDLIGRRWWAYGFPGGDPVGNSADGIIGGKLAYGWVRLDMQSRYGVVPGFSGSGLWSPDYQAVIAIVGQANDRGDARAITLQQVIASFPDEDLKQLVEQFSVTQSGDLALSAWGWSLAEDPEGARHWRPRARGVSVDSERGYRFRGRTAALRVITDWLDRGQLDRRVLVVTGAPGAGKSAVLGRIVTTADPGAVRQLPSNDMAIRSSPGSVACAVHAKGKTALDIATEIARAASAALPERVEDFAPALREALTRRSARRFNVVIDALDEAASPTQARTIVVQVILPLAETCSDIGAQVVIGSRRRDDEGDLLAVIGASQKLVDLDDSQFFTSEDLTAYSQATLQLAGDERPGNPYADNHIAGPVAQRIAQLSDGNFLIAGLTARTHGLYDDEAVNPSELSFSPTVDAAMREYLNRLPPVGGITAEAILTVLASAETLGMPADLWQTAIKALGFGSIPAAELIRFARSSTANFLIESSGQDGRSAVYRLFHQALNDTLLRARAQMANPRDDERFLTTAFIAVGRTDWKHAPEYLLRFLPAHAARAEMLDELLADDEYLLDVDLTRLLPLVDRAVSKVGRDRARMLWLTPLAYGAARLERAAMFSVTEALEDLGNTYACIDPRAPYHAEWATCTPSAERALLLGHTDWVRSVCSFTLDGRTMLATVGDDETVQVWDPATGIRHATLQGHTGPVWSVCAFSLDDRILLATGSEDRTVRIWDPDTGTQRAIMQGHISGVGTLCSLTLGGQILLASGGNDATVRLWDPGTATLQAILPHIGWDIDICAFDRDGQTLLAIGSEDADVRIWDPAAGIQLAVLQEHADSVLGICAFTCEDRVLLASASLDQTVRIWDPVTGTEQAILEGHTDAVNSVCAFSIEGRTMLATGSDDWTIGIWDPGTGTQLATLQGHTDAILSICPFSLHARTLLASASLDRTVRIWDPATSSQQAVLIQSRIAVNAACAFTLADRALLATVGDDATVRIWDVATGAQKSSIRGPRARVTSVSAFTRHGRILLATVNIDPDNTRSYIAEGEICIWDPVTGAQQSGPDYRDDVLSVMTFTQDGRTLLAFMMPWEMMIWDPAADVSYSVDIPASMNYDYMNNAACAFAMDGDIWLAAGGDDCNLYLYNRDTGILSTLQEIVPGPIRSICSFDYDGQTMLAVGDDYGIVQIWDIGERALTAIFALMGSAKIITTFTHRNRIWLAIGSDDRTVLICDPVSGDRALTIPVHHEVQAMTFVDEVLIVGTKAGVLAICLNLEARHLQ